MSLALSARVAWRHFILASAVLMVTQMGLYVTVAALPLYLHDSGSSNDRIGFEVGLGNITALAATLVTGPGINRLGSRLFIRSGAIIYLLAALGMLLIPHEVAIAGFRALQGLAQAMISPGAMTLGSRLLPHRRATAISLMGASNTLALAIAPAAGLTLYSAYGSTGLFLPAIGAAALGLGGSLLLPHLPVAGSAPGFGFRARWLPGLVANALNAVYFGGIVAYLPLTLQHEHGPNAGIFFTADALGVMLLRIPTGFLVDRFGSFLPKILGIAITLGGIGALFLPPSTFALILAGAGTGIGAGLVVTGILADLSRQSTDANRGTALAFGGASFSGGNFAGSAAAGLLIGTGGFRAILLLGAAACVISLPLAVWREPAS